MYLIVGLGNPGEEYIGTRHNVGRDVLHALGLTEGTRNIAGVVVRIAEPDCYMNESGGPTAKALERMGEMPDMLIVVHDDIDLPLGTVKVSYGNGSAGHKGVASIQHILGTHDFTRVRIGICPVDPEGIPRKPEKERVPDFVLEKFRPSEKTVLEEVVIPLVDTELGWLCAPETEL